MSNHLAIAAVTATLRQIVQAATNEAVAGSEVATVRPNAPSAALPRTGVNIFLYRVTPDSAGRNADLPTRRADGTVLRRPSAALDLHYLLSFHGDDATLEPQILLASTVRTLHADPVLERAAIQAMLASLPNDSLLRKSDLAEAPELVRFTPEALSLEEMSKLWSVFFQTPYVLSVVYQASVIFVDAELTASAPGLPVRSTEIRVEPLRRPVLEQILSRSADDQPAVAGRPILAGDTLVLAGHELRGDVTVVRIDAAEVAPLPATDSEIVVRLPVGLRAGTHAVRVVQRVPLGAPPKPHAGPESNPLMFELRPTIQASVVVSAIRVRITPRVAVGQRVTLLLNQLDPPAGQVPRAYRFDASPPSAEVETLDIPFHDVERGTYLVRVQVDGAESPLGFDATTGRYNSPSVAIG